MSGRRATPGSSARSRPRGRVATPTLTPTRRRTLEPTCVNQREIDPAADAGSLTGAADGVFPSLTRRRVAGGVEDARGGDRVGGGHGRLALAADRGRERAVERGPRTRRRRHDLDVVVVALHDPAPPRGRLHAPLIAERPRRVAGDERRLLSVHRAVDDVRRLGAGDAEPWSRGRLLRAPPVVRPRAVRVGERDEHVVVEAVVADRPLGVDRVDRAEEDQRLVDQVAPEVEQRPAPGGLRNAIGYEPFEAALHPHDAPEPPAVDEAPEGEEVGVPPPVLVRRQHEPAFVRRAPPNEPRRRRPTRTACRTPRAGRAPALHP